MGEAPAGTWLNPLGKDRLWSAARGVIGACTAYFLSRRGINVIVVERTEIAAAASGKAGGFLALDWCAGSPLDALARRGFDLHAALRNQIAGDWGFLRMTAYSGFVVPESDPRRHTPAALHWLSDGVVIEHRLSTTETTAIVNPRKFTSAVIEEDLTSGASIKLNGRLLLRPPFASLTWPAILLPFSSERRPDPNQLTGRAAPCEQKCKEVI
jgi:FAD dependent oxidoreductase